MPPRNLTELDLDVKTLDRHVRELRHRLTLIIGLLLGGGGLELAQLLGYA